MPKFQPVLLFVCERRPTEPPLLPLGESATALPTFTPSTWNCTLPVGAVVPEVGDTVAVKLTASP